MKKIVLSVVCLMLFGCVSFTSENTKSVVDYSSLDMGRKPNISINVYTFPTNNGTPVSEKQKELNQRFYSQIKQVFDDTKMFGEVGGNVKNADYKLDVVIKNDHTECYWCNVYNIVTLTLIPSWTNDRFNYEAKLTNNKTAKGAKYDYFEKSREVRQLLLIYAMPFMYNAEDRMHERVFTDLAFKISQEIASNN